MDLQKDDLIKTLVTDLDGVLTDGKQYITSDGLKLFKAFHSRDVAAIRELIYNGWRVVIVSADDDESGVHFANKVGAEFLHLRDKSQIPCEYLVAIGDSAFDVPMLNKAKLAFYVPDMPREIKLENCTYHPLSTRGGEGVMTEVVCCLKKMKLF